MPAPAGPGDARDTLKMIMFILLVVFIAWFFMGGKDRAENVNEPFLNPAAPIDSGEEFGPGDRDADGARVYSW